MRGKFKSGKVTTMYRTQEIDGVQVREECMTQDQMNEAAMTENEERFSRALQGAFESRMISLVFRHEPPTPAHS